MGSSNALGRVDEHPSTPRDVPVLLVEPQDDQRDSIGRALRSAGFPVTETASLLHAARLLDTPGEYDFKVVVVNPVPSASGAEKSSGRWLDPITDGLDRILARGRRGLGVVLFMAAPDGDEARRYLEQGPHARIVAKNAPERALIQAVHDVADPNARRANAKDDLSADEPVQGWIELTAPSQLAFLERVQKFSDKLFARHLPPALCEDMRLIVEEVGRNAIEWGNRFDASKKVTVSYCLFPDRVILKFEDEGEGFHPKDIPDPTLDPVAHIKNREEQGKRPGGYGVFLVQKVMDEVVFSEKGNVVIMTKFIPSPPQA